MTSAPATERPIPLEGLRLRQGAVDLTLESQTASSPEQSLARAKTFLEICRTHQPATPVHTLEIEPSGPVGTGHVQQPQMKELYEALIHGADLDPAIKATDLKLGDGDAYWFGMTVFDGNLRPDHLGARSTLAPAWKDMLRLAIRYAELGHPITAAPGLWSTKPWPADKPTAALLRRAAHVFNVDPTTIRFGAISLAHFNLAASSAAGPRNGGYDAHTSLSNYYLSVALGRRLAGRPEIADALAAFAERLPVPDDLRPLAKETLRVSTAKQLAPFEPVKADDLYQVRTGSPTSKILDERAPIARHEFDVGHRTPMALEAPNWTDATAPYGRNFNAVRYYVTEATDENINSLETKHFNFYNRAPDEGVSASQLLHWYARRHDLCPRWGVQLWQEALTTQSLPKEYYADDCIAPLIRLSAIARLDPATVMVPIADGTLRSLRDRALELNIPRARAAEPSTPQRIARWLEQLADPASTTDQRIEAIERLQQHDEGALTFQQLVDAIATHSPPAIDFATLSPAQKHRLATALTAEPHLGVTSILAGLLTRGAGPSLAPIIKEWRGITPADDKQWQRFASAMPQLSTHDRLFVIDGLRGDPPDFFNTPLRMHLAQSELLDATQVVEVFTAFSQVDPRGVLRTLVDWSASRGAAQVKALSTAFDLLFESKAIGSTEISYALAGERRAHLTFSGVPQELSGAVQALGDADVMTREGAVDHLASLMNATLDRGAPLPVLQILQGVLDRDVKRVLPLDQADHALGGVVARGWSDRRSVSERLGTGPSRAEREAQAPAVAESKSPRFARLAHRLSVAKVRLELSAARDANFDVKADARAQAHQIIDSELQERVSQATAGEAEKLVAVGRVFLADFERWADDLAAALR